MPSRDEDASPPNASRIKTKVKSGAALSVDDVKILLRYVERYDYRELEPYRDDIDDSISGELGHEIYVSILEEFEQAGVFDELRPDLVDPALDPEGFTRREMNTGAYCDPRIVHDERGEVVGSIRPPTKQPTRLLSIRASIRDYLFCIGRGFNFDPERIYDYEADYANFLRCVLEYVDGGDSFDLKVWCDDDGDRRQVTVVLRSEARSYRESFGQGGDWLSLASFDPIEAALAAETTQRLRYSAGGNDGAVLILDAETAPLVDTYLEMLPPAAQ
jgi:hypothetical protein